MTKPESRMKSSPESVMQINRESKMQVLDLAMQVNLHLATQTNPEPVTKRNVGARMQFGPSTSITTSNPSKLEQPLLTMVYVRPCRFANGVPDTVRPTFRELSVLCKCSPRSRQSRGSSLLAASNPFLRRLERHGNLQTCSTCTNLVLACKMEVCAAYSTLLKSA
jgi:hypothetical protein